MTTATITRTELPQLERASIPPEFATVSPELKKLIATRQDMLQKATAARSDFNRKVKAIEQARAADATALTDAALAGKPDPGRANEEKALLELDEAHRQAQATTLAANRVTYEIRDSLNSDTGEKAIEKLQANRDKALTDLEKNANATLDNLAAITGINQLLDTIERTRKGKSRSAVPNGTARVQPVSIHGRPTDPALVLQALTNGYGSEDE